MDKTAPHYIDTAAKLKAVLKELQQHSYIGLDTEFISEGRYEPALCLVQLSVPDQVWIVDPLAVQNLKDLWALLADPSREIVAVAARQEIKFCAKGAGHAPGHVFDLQVAAGLVGYGYPLSHTNLVLKLLNQRIHGGESFTDWRKRPLTALQMKYAADDVSYLLAMREKLVERAKQMKRLDWIEGECSRLVRDVMREEERWRVSGSARLNRRQLGVLRELWRWRDRSARELNLPAMRVLGDSMLVEIAKRSPASNEDLLALRGLDRKLLRNAADEIVAGVLAAQQLTEADLPANTRKEEPPQLNPLTKLLSVAANGLAAQFRIDPALLATTADLQELVRWKLEPSDELPTLLEGWRGDMLSEPLLGILEGKRCVRVGNLEKDNPLVFEECDVPEME
jgi:ribonuclease D